MNTAEIADRVMESLGGDPRFVTWALTHQQHMDALVERALSACDPTLAEPTGRLSPAGLPGLRVPAATSGSGLATGEAEWGILVGYWTGKDGRTVAVIEGKGGRQHSAHLAGAGKPRESFRYSPARMAWVNTPPVWLAADLAHRLPDLFPATPKPTVARLRVTPGAYRGESGFHVSGTDAVGRPVRVFVRDRERADALVEAIRRRASEKEVTAIILGRPTEDTVDTALAAFQWRTPDAVRPVFTPESIVTEKVLHAKAAHAGQGPIPPGSRAAALAEYRAAVLHPFMVGPHLDAFKALAHAATLRAFTGSGHEAVDRTPDRYPVTASTIEWAVNLWRAEHGIPVLPLGVEPKPGASGLVQVPAEAGRMGWVWYSPVHALVPVAVLGPAAPTRAREADEDGEDRPSQPPPRWRIKYADTDTEAASYLTDLWVPRAA